MAVASKTRVTPRQIQETIASLEARARGDFLWTCAHLLQIKTETSPLQFLQLIDSQHYQYERYAKPSWQQRRPLAVVILKSRRARVSTFWEAWLYWAMRWYPGQACLIAAHLDRSVNELYEMVERFHQHLPVELQPKPKTLNRKELAYEGLDSSLTVEAARYMDISRGQLINHVHIAEAPYLPDPETIMAGLEDAVPWQGWSSFILEGTANGMGTWFHEFWLGVGRKQGRVGVSRRHWQRCFIPWFAHPDYWLPVPKGFEMTAEERELQRQYGLTDEQVVWYAATCADKEKLHPGRGTLIMQQEHPSCAEEAFLASGSVVFPPDVIDPLKRQITHPRLGYRFERSGAFSWKLSPVRVSEAAVLVWEEPREGYEYAIGVDVSSGSGSHESTIVVVRMPGFVQVAEWGDDQTSPGDLAGLVACVARYYAGGVRGRSVPIVNVDITGGWGMDTNNRLGEFYSGEPLQLYIWEAFDRLAPAKVGPGARTGWLFTWVSKNILISTALNLMKERLVTVPSRTIQEDLRALDEVRLSRRVTVEMGGHDRAVAWLLAVVAAWRKIARWSWPGSGFEEEAAPKAQEWVDPARYDTTVKSLYEEVGVGRGSTGGDLDVPWQVQM